MRVYGIMKYIKYCIYLCTNRCMSVIRRHNIIMDGCSPLIITNASKWTAPYNSAHFMQCLILTKLDLTSKLSVIKRLSEGKNLGQIKFSYLNKNSHDEFFSENFT